MKQVELFLGRLQPVHKGHKKILDSMKNPIVVLVKGNKSTMDKKRNPLDAEYQSKLLKKIMPNITIEIASSGFLPVILSNLRKKGIEVTKVYAGADRITGYEAQVKNASDYMKSIGEVPWDITFVETERVTSASAVRAAIRSNNEEQFKKLAPKEIWGEWDNLRKLIESMEEYNIMDFEHWINEEPVTTSDVVFHDKPLFGKMRKKLRRCNIS
jgi:hypothetical protein